ncbi:MAG: hypothetical protein AB7T07_12515 [Steroidobacteraceae bacterium]
MKSLTAQLQRASLAVIALSSLMLMQGAQAAGTAANTDISNIATVNYSVGSVAQTAVNSNTTTFKVDRKVDLTVTAGSATPTNPGATNAAVIYTVTNTGNGTDSFTLAGANQTGDNFDVNNIKIYQDNGATAGTFDAGDTLVSAPVSFTADQSIKFFIVSDVPLSATNGQSSIVKLTATTTSTQTTGADTAGVDVVFADAGNNGTENANNTYNISAATLAVVKSAAVISDPVNNTTNPKAIPGAVIEYTIAVTNSGAAAASAVTLTDNIPTNTTYVANSMKLGATALTDAADADGGATTGAPTVTSITVNAGTVAAAGGTATVKFRVTVN